MPLHRLPGTARGDAHLLVVVALGAAGGERVAEPEAEPPRDLVGRVGERRGALVGRHHQVRVVAVPPDHAGWRYHPVAVDVVGHVEHGRDERLVAGQHLGLVRLAVGRVGQALAHEAALGAGRDDDRVLDFLRLDQAEHLGAEVLEPVRPAQSATRHPAEAQVHRLQPGGEDEDLELGPRLHDSGDRSGVQLEHQRTRAVHAGAGAGAVLLVVVRPQGGVDQRQVGPQDPVGVQAGHLVELAADLLGDGLAALVDAALPGRVEPGLEQPDQQPGDGRVGAQHPLHVVLAEAHPALAQILGVGAQQVNLAPGQAGHQHQGVEPVVLVLAVPQRGQRVLEDLPEAAGRGRRRGPQAELVDPERAGRGAPLERVRVLVDDLDPHVLQLRQHVGQRDRGTRPVHHERPSLGVLHQPDRELPTRLAQREHGGQIVDRVRGRHVRLVGLGDPRAAQLEHLAGPLLAEHADRLGGEVLVPRPDRRGQLALERDGVHLRHRPSRLAPDHHVQPGQGRVADRGAVVHRDPVQRRPQNALRAQPDLSGVPVPGQVDQAGHVPPVPVPAQEQPGLLALLQPQHAQRDRGELLGRDLEQLVARVVLQDLDQVLAVVAVPGHLGLGQDLGQLAAEHGHVGDGRGMRRVRVQPEEPVLPDDSVVGPELLDRDVVQVAGPVDGGPGVGLGQHQALGRVLRAARDLGRHLADRLLARLGVAQDAEAGAGHGAQPGAVGGPDQVVLAVAEEEEVAVGQPAEQIAVLGPVAAGLCPSLAAQVCGQAAGHRAHPRLILDRDPHVVEHVPELGRELIRGHLVLGRAELHVDPGFGDLVGFGLARNIGRGIGAHAEDPAQRAGHVPAHPQHRVHQQPDLGLVPVQLGGDRVDQVGHVVDDDVDDQAGPADRVQLGVRGLADLDQRPPLRPGQTEPGVRLGHRRQPRRRSQVLGGDALVIGAQVAPERSPRRRRRLSPAGRGPGRPPRPAPPWRAGLPWPRPRNRPASRPLPCVLCLPPGGDPPGTPRSRGATRPPYPPAPGPGGTCRNT